MGALANTSHSVALVCTNAMPAFDARLRNSCSGRMFVKMSAKHMNSLWTFVDDARVELVTSLWTPCLLMRTQLSSLSRGQRVSQPWACSQCDLKAPLGAREEPRESGVEARTQ